MGALKEINNSKSIRKILRDLSRKDDSVSTIYGINDRLYKGIIKNNGLLLKLFNDEPALSIGETIKVTFVLKEIYFLYDAIIKGNDENGYIIDLPEVIFSSFNRMISRFKIDENEEAYIKFMDNKFKIIDINTMGLSFYSKDCYFNEGETISAELELDNTHIGSIEGTVKYSVKRHDNKIINGFTYSKIDWGTHYELFMYIFKRKYPFIRSLGEFDRDSVHELFGEYIKKKPKDEIEKNFKEMIDTLGIIHDKPEISANIAYYYDNKLLTTASALRIYEKTFLGHQLVSIPSAITNIRSKVDIYFSLTDYLMNHLSFEYYISYFFTDLPWHIEMFQYMSQFINDNNKVIIDSILFFECDVQKVLGSDVGENSSFCYCIPLENAEEFIEYCSNNISELEAKCYSYNENISLNEIAQLYNKYDLEIHRKIWSVYSEGRLAAYAVGEVYSSGLNLFNITDMCRIYFTNEKVGRNAVIRAIISSVSEWFHLHNKEKFNLIFKYEEDINIKIDLHGVTENPYPFGRLMANKQGGAEYWKLLSINIR